MANEILNGDDVLVEFSENNILLVDPNRIYQNGQAVDRAVKHENLTIYANLKARVVPRSKLISGVGIDSETPEAFVDVFEGEINFLKPGSKEYMTTDWADSQTGKGFNVATGGGNLNQKVYTTLKDINTGEDVTTEKITNKLDTESFGIESISVTLNRSYTPTVQINFVDVRGQTLFEQGKDSPYAAFFQLPYPLFKLILKGYYGKAVEYQLMCQKFNASFDASSGNYIVTCSFIGRISALLNDITLQELKMAPYMFSKTYEINDGESDPRTVITSKGRQTLHEVYTGYKNLGLVSQELPEMTLVELIEKVEKLETDIQQNLKKEDLEGLDDIDNYERNVLNYRRKILESGGWKYIHMEHKLDSPQHFIVNHNTQQKYYRWTKFYQDDVEKRTNALTELDKHIETYNNLLLDNKTFGKNGISAIPINITFNDFLAPPSDLIAMGEAPDAQWFIFDTRATTFGVKIGKIIAQFNAKRNQIEQKITGKINSTVIDILGFKPTIRNLFAILIAQADTFLRLMDETHTKAFAVRDSQYRLEAVKGDGKSNQNTEPPEQPFVYPWPHYYVRKETEGTTSFVSTYPGAYMVQDKIMSYDATLWPEVNFVEEYLKAHTVKDNAVGSEFTNTSISQKWLPITSFDLFENDLYAIASYTTLSYEIWDRATVHTFFSGIIPRITTNQGSGVLDAWGMFEALNIKQRTQGFFQIREFWKNQTFNYNTFLDYLKELAPLTDYQILLEDNYNTPYLRTKIHNSRFSLLPASQFEGVIYSVDDADIKNEEALLESVLQVRVDRDNILETYPLSDFLSPSSNIEPFPWVKENLAGGQYIKSYEELNYIHNGVQYGKDQKMYTSFPYEDTLPLNVRFYSNARWAVSKLRETWDAIGLKKVKIEEFQLYYQDILTKRTTETDHNTNLKYKEVYDNYILKENFVHGKNHNMFLTEGPLNYGNQYSGNTTPTQVTSILNTPYFINGLIQGINNEINDSPTPYVAASYLFLNSLPLGTLREKTIESIGNISVYGDYIAKVLNQVSAVHPLPYAWILKYGSIWHRYKNFVKTGTDILTDVWDNYDAGTYFNADNGISHTYNLDVGPSNSSITFGGQWYIGGNFTKMNVGVYPELNNLINYFITGRLLYNGTNITGAPLTSNEINAFISNDALILKEANELIINTEPNTLNQDMNCSFWYGYYDLSRDGYLTGYSPTQYYLFPSCGGMKTQQLQFETKESIDLLNNPSVHNGAIRLAWGMSNYGFFQHNKNTFPSPTQYFKVIDSEENEQYAFNITNQSEYASIEELFDIFTPDILDVFEQYFLNFSEKDSAVSFLLPGFSGTTHADGVLPDDNYAPTSATLGVTNYKSFQSIIRNILVVDHSAVKDATDNTQLSFNLGEAQLTKINSVLTHFLSEKMAFNFYNPKDIDPRVLRSFAGSAKFYEFGPTDGVEDRTTNTYTGNLPPEISFSQSQLDYPLEWETLKLEVGFYTDPVYPTQTFTIPYFSGGLPVGTIQVTGTSLTTSALSYSGNSSLVTDFFREMNIAFTIPNIKALRKVIRMYVTQRINNKALVPGYSGDTTVQTTFRTQVQTLMDKLDTAQGDLLEQLFEDMRKIFPDIRETQADEAKKNTAMQTDENKLEQYLLFKAFNDKWIGGEDYSSKFLFKDFLFFDVANRDIGDVAILDTDRIKEFNNPDNAKLSLLHIISRMLQGNFFNFLALPSYINFYGITSTGNNTIPKLSTREEANALFGTHLEVDFLDSSPKFLCQYVGETSNQLADLNEKTKYNNDSFNIGRTADNPLFSNCYDPQRCNKVVAFAVDFGIQSQGIFKGISLDTTEFQNTSESYGILEAMAQSTNDKSIKSQGLNLFNVYKSRSYTCKIEAMGNVCIQPTMYFSLRHVPMFNGPYMILSVEHNIQPNTMTTTFTGVRVPFHQLPAIENLVGKVNKSFINKIKTKIKNEEALATQGGFDAENEDEEKVHAATTWPAANSDKVKMLIIHVTGGLDYGSNPVERINKQHKDRGFAGIGYHYVISRGTGGSRPDGTLYAARPDTYIGAHVRGKNTESLGISMIADCAKIGYYDSKGDYATTAQKTTLEWVLLALLFKKRIFYLKKVSGKLELYIRPINITVTDPENISDSTRGVTSAIWYKVIKGHNDFTNRKRCPCFKVQTALNGTFGINLRKNLAIIIQEINMSLDNASINNEAQSIAFSKLGSGRTLVATPYQPDKEGDIKTLA